MILLIQVARTESWEKMKTKMGREPFGGSDCLISGDRKSWGKTHAGDVSWMEGSTYIGYLWL
jgi:hypothetical protein